MLLSSWFMWALVGVTGALGGEAVLLERRRLQRRRHGTIGRGRAWLGRVVSVAVLVSAVSATIADHENRQYSYIPSFAALLGDISPNLRHGGLSSVKSLQHNPQPGAPRGVVVEIPIPGKVSALGARPAYVYLPSAYFSRTARGQRFPVLYMLHGSPGVAADWVRGGQLDRAMERLSAAGAVSPFIVVMPDVNGGYRRDLECQNVPGGVADETYLSVDVVRYIDAHFRTINDRRQRAIGGLSTGGYCAINIAFHHQDLFSAVVSHSGSGRPDHSRYTGNLFGNDRARKRANTPDLYLGRLPISYPMAVYLDSGARDQWSRPETRRLQEILAAKGVPLEVHVFGGQRHSFTAWRTNLTISLPWLSKQFERTGSSSKRASPPIASARYEKEACTCGERTAG